MNWLQLGNLQGISTSPSFTVPLQVDGALTKISWKYSSPPGTKIIVQTRLSFSNGADWTEWRICTNGGAIPDLSSADKIDHPQMMYRVIISSPDYAAVPAFEEITFTFEPVIIIDNTGDLDCKPEIWITKEGNGDFSIVNLSSRAEEFKFSDLIDQETIYIDNEQEDIETSLAATYRYSNFNDNYLNLPAGSNLLKLSGKAKVQFRYQFKYL
ncbi:phage tail domain-containing protein [Paenibacillus lentus]|uniref:Phage tail-like C-terminal domain-containing protein n=1 Tax=Paenibacillus lentus TaxID=1338368 RepID=A0A3Q8SC02_9BACL|nr:phage tail domain-containing protein [Paenibacillus lentus]AZK47115.1 hypothetical protein EIM92_13900 [Paenibacillus lentus]